METCPHAHTRQIGDDRPFMGPVSTRDENRAAHGNITRTVECVDCGAHRSENINQCHVEASEWYDTPAERQMQLTAARDQAYRLREEARVLRARIRLLHPEYVVHLDATGRTVRVSIDEDGYLRVRGLHTDADVATIVEALPEHMLASAQQLRSAVLGAIDAEASL